MTSELFSFVCVSLIVGLCYWLMDRGEKNKMLAQAMAWADENECTIINAESMAYEATRNYAKIGFEVRSAQGERFSCVLQRDFPMFRRTSEAESLRLVSKERLP